MKINSDYISYDIGGELTLVATGESAAEHHGIVRCNETAAAIVNCLQQDTTESEIVEQLLKQYNATREEIASSVSETVEKLRTIGALEE